jgi:gas vesicle protein
MGRRDDNSLELTFAFLLGGVVGATVALLFAPASGEQTRKKIRETTDEVSTNVKEEYGRIRDKAEIEVSRLRNRASDGINQAKSYYDQKKSKLKDAYGEGKRAFEEEQEKDQLTAPTPSSDNT